MTAILVRTAVLVRPVRQEDLPGLIELCREHAAYENAPYADDGQQSRLGRALFGNPPSLYCWIAADDRELAGYMTATREYATWSAGFFIHMDCIYLREPYRHLGIGRQLLRTLVDFARQQHCREIQWQTPPDNELGIAFYERIGARAKEKRRYILQLGPV
jgi:ribosomal protein S18 acetylase RimI-like enzyme